MRTAFPLRLARAEDISDLERLIPISVHALQSAFYSEAQRRAALGPVFGVDRQLIRDGTYFVVEHGGLIVGCGGWSGRESVFGGDAGRPEAGKVLDPASDPARVRAFFVHPDWTRRGIGKTILSACESAMTACGFRNAMLVATLAGEPLYASCGYTAARRYEIPLANDLTLPVVEMRKHLPIHATCIRA
jgi:GNAT superfamily N-acetyltransferase